MKNKLYYILLSLIVSFSFINNVFAGDFVISADVDNSEVVKGTEVAILINLRSSEAIKECRFIFESDDNIVFKNISSVNGWIPDSYTGTDGIIISNSSWSTEAPVNGQGIAQLKYTVNGDGKVIIKTEQCVSTVDDEPYEYDDIVVNLTATEPVENTTLSSLTVTGGQLTPVFSPTDTDISYIITLNSPNFGLSMTTSNPDYQNKIVVKDENGNVITDPSNITFSDPSGQQSMPLTITVNEKTVYSITVIYSQKELDNTLESIKINGEEIFKEGQQNYQYTVDKDVAQIEIEPILKDSENFQFGSKSNFSGIITIADSAYVIIVVEPKSSDIGAEQLTYTIEIVKEKDSSSNNNNAGTNNGGSSNSNNNGNVNSNPGTGDISMFIMAFILVASLVCSIILYRKNLESYK